VDGTALICRFLMHLCCRCGVSSCWVQFHPSAEHHYTRNTKRTILDTYGNMCIIFILKLWRKMKNLNYYPCQLKHFNYTLTNFTFNLFLIGASLNKELKQWSSLCIKYSYIWKWLLKAKTKMWQCNTSQTTIEILRKLHYQGENKHYVIHSCNRCLNVNVKLFFCECNCKRTSSSSQNIRYVCDVYFKYKMN
jgi:hypothetical protein